MPPKKEKGKKQEMIIGEYCLMEMTAPELQAFALELQKELEKTRDESKFFSIERDRLEHFWKVTKKEVENKKMEIAAKEREIEDLTYKYENLLEEKDQKLKYIDYESTNKLKEKNLEFNLEYRNAVDNLMDQRRRGLDRIQETDKESKKLQMSYENLVRGTNRKRYENMTEITQYYETRLSETIDKYEYLYEEIRRKANLYAKTKIHIMESFKSTTTKDSRTSHIASLEQMDKFFKDITAKCFNLIDVLKLDIEHRMKSEKEMKMMLRKTLRENESLHDLKQEILEGKVKLDQYQRDKKTFTLTRKSMLECIQKLKDLEFENHMVTEKLTIASMQKEKLNTQFVSALRKIQERTSLKNVFLEKKLEAYLTLLWETEEKPSPSDTQPPADFRDSSPFGLSPGTSSRTEHGPQQKSNMYPIKVINVNFEHDDVRFSPPQRLEKY